jgi:hypothetical protein
MKLLKIIAMLLLSNGTVFCYEDPIPKLLRKFPPQVRLLIEKKAPYTRKYLAKKNKSFLKRSCQEIEQLYRLQKKINDPKKFLDFLKITQCNVSDPSTATLLKNNFSDKKSDKKIVCHDPYLPKTINDPGKYLDFLKTTQCNVSDPSTASLLNNNGPHKEIVCDNPWAPGFFTFQLVYELFLEPLRKQIVKA